MFKYMIVMIGTGELHVLQTKAICFRQAAAYAEHLAGQALMEVVAVVRTERIE